MEKTPFIFNLSDAIDYSKKGDFEKTASIEILAPSFNTYKECLPLAQFVARAMIQHGKENAQDGPEQGKENADLDAKTMQFLLMASGCDLSAAVDLFKNLCSKTAYLDSEKSVTLNETLFSKIDISDVLEMMCGYIANFILPLALPMI